MARGKAVIPGLLLLAVALAGCGASSVGTQLVAPPAATASPATVVVTLPATPAAATPTAAAVPTAPPSPAPTSPPGVAPSPTRTAPPPSPTVPPPTVPTRPPTATPTKPPPPPATRPPPPPAPPPTAVPGGKARSVARGPATRRMIALTFDAGADRGFAAGILDTLRDSGVQATFGMTGKWAEQNPDLIRRMVAEGHLLMNHTYDHASFTGYSPATRPLTADERRREIERTEGVIAAIAGAPLRPYFRPPYGDYDDAMLVQLGQLGYAYNVMWTVDSLGWNGRTAAQIVQRCVDGAAPGAILLFHVGAESQDAAALPELIRRLRADGYTFGTIAELLR